MGVCFRLPKLPLNKPSVISCFQAENNLDSPSSSTIPVKPPFSFSSPVKPQIVSKASPEDMCPLRDISSGALAGIINPGFRPSQAKPLFLGPSRASSANSNSFVINICDENSNEVTYSEHINLYEHENPTEILPTIFLGSKEDSAKVTRLKEIGITHILCVMSGKQYDVQGCKLLTVPMADNGKSNLESIMKRSFPFIEESQQKGNKLLIHCKLGQNRSPSLLISWLMSKKRWSFYSAHRFVKQARAMIQPHKLYVQQLRALDKELFGIHSTPDDYLAIYMSGGEVRISETFTPVERLAYKSSQITLMSLATGHESTESNSFISTRALG